MHDVLRFWLDRGVDGFRMDVVHAIGKDPALPDDPPECLPIPHSALNHDPTHPRARPGPPGAARRVRRRPHDGRRGLPPRHRAGRRVLRRRRRRCTSRSTSRRCSRRWDAGQWRRRIERGRARARAARAGRRGSSRTTTTPATAPATAPRPGPGPPPCCCSGCGARRSSTPARSWAWRTPWCRRTGWSTPAGATAAGRRSRGPPRPDHGWGADDPWLPVAPGRRRSRTPRPGGPTTGSILHLYRRLLAARRASPALRGGDQTLLDAPDGVLAWDRAGRRRPAPGAGQLHRRAGRRSRSTGDGWMVAIASDGRAGDGAPFGRRARRPTRPSSGLATAGLVSRLGGTGPRGPGCRRRRRPGRPRRRPGGGWARRPARPASPRPGGRRGRRRAAPRCRRGWPAARCRSRRSRASWLTQADTRATAGRRLRSSSWSVPVGPGDGPGRRPASTAASTASPTLPLAWRSSTPADALAGRRASSGGAGRRRPPPGRPARSAPAGRARRPAARARRPRLGRRRAPCPAACRASLMRSQASSGSRTTRPLARSASHSSSAQSSRPRSSSCAVSWSWSPSRYATSAAA